VVLTIIEQVNSGLDRAIMTMKKGEHAAVTVDTEYLRGGDDASCKFLASL